MKIYLSLISLLLFPFLFTTCSDDDKKDSTPIFEKDSYNLSWEKDSILLVSNKSFWITGISVLQSDIETINKIVDSNTLPQKYDFGWVTIDINKNRNIKVICTPNNTQKDRYIIIYINDDRINQRLKITQESIPFK